MTHPLGNPLRPGDPRALVAIDLGAESCRVSLLRWHEAHPKVELVYRFPNNPREIDGGLRWDLQAILSGVDEGLRKCAGIASEGIRSIAVDGWAVDYVRINAAGKPLADPFCYRDERNVRAEQASHAKCSKERLRELTGVQIISINTIYQLYADQISGQPQGRQWLNLPEYLL